MTRVRTIAAALLLVAGVATGAELSPLQRQQLLSEAQAAYDEGVSVLRRDPGSAVEAFRTAAERFGQLLDDGVVNGRLHYNLANAWLQAGELGRAILHYRAAEAMMPGDPRVRHNLEYARSLRRSNIPPSGRRALGEALLGWLDAIPRRVRLEAGFAAWVAFWGALGLHLFAPRRLWPWLAGSLTLIWLAAAASLLADADGPDHSEGIVLVDDVIVRKGNSEGFEPQFAEPLHQGVEFIVLEHRADWIRIELPDGKTGWIRADQAGLIE